MPKSAEQFTQDCADAFYAAARKEGLITDQTSKEEKRRLFRAYLIGYEDATAKLSDEYYKGNLA